MPHDLREHASDNLRFIRATLENAGSFTAVPGWGGVWMGVSALAASWLASQQEGRLEWLTVWLAEAAVAALIGFALILRKAARSNASLLSAPARKFALGYLPPLLAGGAVTAAIHPWVPLRIIAATWILFYGVAVTTGGAFSVRIVPLMGLTFMLCGAVTYLLPDAATNYAMALTFGVMHIAFGLIIARRYGG